MKAALVTEWGRDPVYTDVSDPEPRDGAEVAAVEASALTNLTRALVSGKHYASKEIQLPAIPGVDGVARLADGRRIYTGALGYY
ncbi:zinc-binding alcohol dehydrogenase family protein, partial [Streptomyces sp. DSM 41529]|nr:zinc-binding alcohol dehydrogenase family protein [Streptomyces sp. DSM 41529]